VRVSDAYAFRRVLIGDGETSHLEDLQDRKEIFLQPVFEIPHDKMFTRYRRMDERLVAEISKKTAFNNLMKKHFDPPYLSFLFGAPPPIHQSTIHRRAFKLSSRPPFPFPRSAMPLRVSNALILCSGLLCTRSVSALSLSDSVPD